MIWCTMFRNGEETLKTFLIEVTHQVMWMAQHPGVSTVMSGHGCPWHGRSLPTTLLPSKPLIPWRPKLIGHHKLKRTFLQHTSSAPLLLGWACLLRCLGSSPKGPSTRSSSWQSHWMKAPLRKGSHSYPTRSHIRLWVSNIKFEDGILEARSNVSQKEKQEAFSSW